MRFFLVNPRLGQKTAGQPFHARSHLGSEPRDLGRERRNRMERPGRDLPVVRLARLPPGGVDVRNGGTGVSAAVSSGYGAEGRSVAIDRAQQYDRAPCEPLRR